MSQPRDPADVALATLIKELPVPACSVSQREESRTALLASVARDPIAPSRGTARRRRGLISIGGACIVLLLGVGLTLATLGRRLVPVTGEQAVYRAGVLGGSGAQFRRQSHLPDEVVRLAAGTIRCDVAKLHAGERFRVLVGDAEVEAWGTAFDVSAERDVLTAVRVHEGVVAVRRPGQSLVRLSAGERWTAPPPREAPAADVAGPAPSTADRRDKASVPLASGRVPPEELAIGKPSPGHTHPSRRTIELAFSEGWDALQRGDDERAADAFDRASRGGAEPLTEDALFWQAVALTKAKQARTALDTLEQFLLRFPRSDRAGEASTMAGWLLLDAGERARARQMFAAGARDRVGPVRRSAYAGLAALGSRTEPPAQDTNQGAHARP